MPLPATELVDAVPTGSMCIGFFMVPVAVLLVDVDDATGAKPLCRFDDDICCDWFDDAIEFGKYDDKSDVLADVLAFLQIGGGFEWSKSK